MIIAGNCLYVDESDTDHVWETAKALRGIATHFRCKLWGGGTGADRYFPGIGAGGTDLLKKINKVIMPCGTEIQDIGHFGLMMDLDYLWVGARNSQNYSLLSRLSKHPTKTILLKRGFGMTIDELIGLYDICQVKHGFKDIYLIERGINTFDRNPFSRWSPDLKGMIRLKTENPDIFDRIIVDCSHSVGKKDYVADTYRAFKAIGVKHFMFECTIDGMSRTDSGHMLSVKELENILV